MGTRTMSLVEIERYNRRHGRPLHKPCQCVVCFRVREDVGWKGRCLDCSVNKVKQVVKELKERKGHYHNKWRQGLKKFIERRQ